MRLDRPSLLLLRAALIQLLSAIEDVLGLPRSVAVRAERRAHDGESVIAPR